VQYNDMVISFFPQARPSQRGAQVASKYKQCAKKIPKVPPTAVNGSSFVNESMVAEAMKEENLLAKEEPTVLQEHVGLLSLQNIDRNRDSACHEAFFEERNVRHDAQPAESKTG
jgi:cyclin-A